MMIIHNFRGTHVRIIERESEGPDEFTLVRYSNGNVAILTYVGLYRKFYCPKNWIIV